jgi:DNA-directed RNA polymerase specialized sigma24 family protein
VGSGARDPSAARGSVTQLLDRLRAGEPDALSRVVERFWGFLLARAGRRLGGAPRRAADEEDVAQEVWADLARGMADGRWPQLANRHDLVALLTQITDCKAVNQIKHELARKRGGGGVWDEARLGPGGTGSGPGGLEEAARDPALPPPELALRSDWWDHCLAQLPDSLRPVAEMHLAGHAVAEIAAALECSERTVARKLALIRAAWLDLLQRAEGQVP